jgi:CubicO group peptidase (beta-lactamase class C family)
LGSTDIVLANDLQHFPDPKSLRALGDFEISAPAFCDEGTTDRSNGTKICTREDLLKAIASRPLAFEPYTRPLYSNTGFNLLGWAVAKAASQSSEKLISQDSQLSQAKSVTLEDLLSKDVFEPLKMQDSSFWVPLGKRDNVAVPRNGTPSMIDWEFTSTFNPYPPYDIVI